MNKFARKIKRRKNGRTTCPKCHAKLIEKSGYGLVCQECGWWKQKEEELNEENTDIV